MCRDVLKGVYMGPPCVDPGGAPPVPSSTSGCGWVAVPNERVPCHPSSGDVALVLLRQSQVGVGTLRAREWDKIPVRLGVVGRTGGESPPPGPSSVGWRQVGVEKKAGREILRGAGQRARSPARALARLRRGRARPGGRKKAGLALVPVRPLRLGQVGVGTPRDVEAYLAG